MIYVCDAICGSGKTTAAINYMNEHDEESFLYITPLLNEVQRIKTSCKGFVDPKRWGTKIQSLRYYLGEGKNIASTHALFEQMDANCIETATLNDYTLIIDEVADVVRPLDIEEHDMKHLLDKYLKVEENGMLSWDNEENYGTNGEFYKYRVLCDLGCLALYNDQVFMWMFPVSIFTSFKDVYILTYMFNAQVQRYYYDYFGVKFENIYVKDFRFTNEEQQYNEKVYKDLITIVQNDKMNKIGSTKYSLSKNWYMRNSETAIIKRLKKDTTNFFKNITKTKSNENMYATFKDYEYQIKGSGYSKCLVSLGSRATNQYRNKKSLAYLVDIYINPNIKQFFKIHGIDVDEDAYALSEMLQWIFRSAIRDKKPVVVYVPSKRMRTLLEDYLRA